MTMTRLALGSLFVVGALAAIGCAAPADNNNGYEDTFDTSSEALSQGHSMDQLVKAGWTCYQPRVPFPPFILPKYVCAQPGVGGGPPVPSLGEDGRPTYHLKSFDLQKNYTGYSHFVRQDLYQGQTCSGTDQPYILRLPIGYYECIVSL